ncbi:MAG: hypothetical protein C0490_03440 [Marivirga sp.]|nr:hypothetical protein [Marivirga sp.]
MKNTTIAALLFCFACDESSVKNPSGGPQLSEIRADGKIQQTFEYSNGLLAKENVFGVCIDNPSDEYAYSYADNKLNNIHLTIRGIYSNLAALCDPAKGLRYKEYYEYNSNNDIIGISRENSYTTFIYNSEGLVEKQFVEFDQGTLETTYAYDVNGNLIAETDPDGNVTWYQYDNRKNPYYDMNQRPGWISPFNKSPNNVIRASGHYNFERTLLYNSEGFPTEIMEDNGIRYVYVYR